MYTLLGRILSARSSKVNPVFDLVSKEDEVISRVLIPKIKYADMHHLVKLIITSDITKEHINKAVEDLISISTSRVFSGGFSASMRVDDAIKLLKLYPMVMDSNDKRVIEEYFYLLAEPSFLLGTNTLRLALGNSKELGSLLVRHRNTYYIFVSDYEEDKTFRKIVMIWQFFMLHYGLKYKLYYHRIDQGSVKFVYKWRFGPKKRKAPPLAYPRDDHYLLTEYTSSVDLLRCSVDPVMCDRIYPSRYGVLANTLVQLLSAYVGSGDLMQAEKELLWKFQEKFEYITNELNINYDNFENLESIRRLIAIFPFL